MSSLWTALENTGRLANQRLHGHTGEVALGTLVHGSWLGGRLPELRDRSVLILVRDQLAAATAIVELDGIARRMVLCPPDLASEHLPYVAAAAEAEAVVHDRGAPLPAGIGCCVPFGPEAVPFNGERVPQRRTEWVLLTSGTTGPPKLVLHSLASLTGAIRAETAAAGSRIWSTFYDIRRYGGLQILLRALVGGNSMVLSDANEAVDEFLHRVVAGSVTHISGTPTHWRRALMSQGARRINPRYVRLSGEIADQEILDWLAAEYPRADRAHAFASTEAGVAFTVADGRAGFPAGLLHQPESGAELKIVAGSLRIRSNRVAERYLGNVERRIADEEGFVDTGDLVERRGERYIFIGRRDGIINVGGMKVHPEEVEAVINRHPEVQQSLARARRNAVVGAVVVADVVLRSAPRAAADDTTVKAEILDACRRSLAPHKVPASLRLVPSLAVGPAGKLIRRAAPAEPPFRMKANVNVDATCE